MIHFFLTRMAKKLKTSMIRKHGETTPCLCFVCWAHDSVLHSDWLELCNSGSLWILTNIRLQKYDKSDYCLLSKSASWKQLATLRIKPQQCFCIDWFAELGIQSRRVVKTKLLLFLLFSSWRASINITYYSIWIDSQTYWNIISW